MKITKSFTLDIEIWWEFEKKVKNGKYSETIQSLIKAYNDTEEIVINKLDLLEKEKKQLQAKLAKRNNIIKKLEEEERKRKEEEEQRKQQWGFQGKKYDDNDKQTAEYLAWRLKNE